MRSNATQLSELASHCLKASKILAFVLLFGCNDRAVVVKPEESGILPPPNPPSAEVAVKPSVVVSAGQKPWRDPKSPAVSMWYSQYQNSKCIGYTELTVRTGETQGQLLSLTKRDIIEIPATSTSPIQRREIVLESQELADGTFKRYTETSSVGATVTESTVVLQNETLLITKTTDGQNAIQNLAWPVGTWGPLGTFAILQQQPMGPNERREAKIFVPSLAKIVDVEFKSKKWELTPLTGGLVSELLLVETLFITGNESTLTKNWVNRAGEIVKSVSQGGFSMFQATREEAERIDASIRAAQLLESKIPLQVNFDQLRTNRLTFSIDSTNADPFGLLSSKVNQRVKSLSALGAALTVERAIPTDPIPDGITQDPPEDSHLQKFSSDTAQLQKFLSEVPEATGDSLTIASQLTGAVFRKLEKTPLVRSFSTPGQTIQLGKGDCKAHSLLLIAALRERDIPARAASGLRIVKEKDGDQLFAIYHMWCEAWVGDRWMPLEPFAGSIGVGVDHIKFSESSLNEKNPIAVMLSVLQNMSQLKISAKP